MKIQNNINISQNTSKQPNLSKINNYNNSQISISKSIYNSSCPVGVNYYNPSFGLKNPKAAMLRAENLKDKYAVYGLKFLLPNETLDNKKIFGIIHNVSNEWDKLSQKNEISEKSLNNLLTKVLPQNLRDKIDIKDISYLKADLIKEGYSPIQAEMALRNVKGMASHNDVATTIYMAFNKNDLDSKVTFEHELKHALTARASNRGTSDIYNKRLARDLAQTEQEYNKLNNELNNHNNVFSEVYRTFTVKPCMAYPMEMTSENIAGKIVNTRTGKNDYQNLEEVAQDISKEFTHVIDKYKKTYEGNLLDNAYDNKSFWNMMKHSMQDEKEAYKTDFEFRRFDKNTPADIEVRSKIFEEIEKYCNKMVKASK